MSQLIRIRTYSDRMSAENAKNFLEAGGIEAMLSTDDAGGTRPELTLARGVKLWVNEEDEKETRELLRDIEAKNKVEDDAGPGEEPGGFITRLRRWLRGI